MEEAYRHPYIIEEIIINHERNVLFTIYQSLLFSLGMFNNNKFLDLLLSRQTSRPKFPPYRLALII